MRKLLFILLLLPFAVSGQVSYQLNYDSIRVGKTAGTGGTSLYGKTYLKNVGLGLVSDSILTVLNGKIRKIPAAGIISMGAFGSTANANGGTISGNTLTLQPASASFPGGVTTGTQTFAGDKTLTGALVGTTGSFASSGGSDTFTINHSSGAGIALNITKGGAGEGIYVDKTSGSGNAVTIIGTLNATTLVKSGGTSAQFLKADGTVDSTPYQGAITLTTTGTSGVSTLIGNTLNVPNYADGGVLSLSAIGAVPNANAATISGTVLNLQPANASFGGVVTTGPQTFAGEKTFSGTSVIVDNQITLADNVLTGELIGGNVQALKLTGNTPSVATGLYVRNIDNTVSGRNISGVYIEAANGLGGYYNSSMHTYGSNYNVAGFRGKAVFTNDSGTGTILRSINSTPGSAILEFMAGDLGYGTDTRLTITNAAATFTVPLASPTLTTPILGVFAATTGTIASSSATTTDPTDAEWLKLQNTSNTNNNWSGLGMKDAQGSDGVVYAAQYVDHTNNQADAVILARPSGGNLTEVARFLGTGATTLAGPLSGTSATFSSTISASNLTSGTYTPTLTGVANVASSIANAGRYVRIGNQVIVYNHISVTPTATLTDTQIRITLPISATLGSTTASTGSGTARSSLDSPVLIIADTVNNESILYFKSSSTSAHAIDYSFSYTMP
jgi:hypothetical protein